MPQNLTDHAKLSPQQARAVERLALGATVIAAAESAGVGRETVHRWCREHRAFQAALNQARRDLQEAVQRRLLAVAEIAAANVAAAVEAGNLNASLSILRGLGALSGIAERIGSDDAEVLAEEAMLREQEAKNDRLLRTLTSGA